MHVFKEDTSFFQIVSIVRDFGLVVLSRGGTKPHEMVYKSDALNQYKVRSWLFG